MNRPQDKVRIATTNGSAGIIVDRLTAFEITNSLTEPAQAVFELGDEGDWKSLAEAIAIGNRWAVTVNDRVRLTGRMISRRLPISSEAGATVQLTVRTKLADAQFASANPAINVSKSTLKDVVLQAYAALDMGEEDFYFEPDLAVDVMTGKSNSTGRRADLEAIKEDSAKVHPPETIYAFVERHLNRFHLSHWDGADGRIIIGAPDNDGMPFYKIQCRRNDPQGNNVLSAERTEDYEQTPSMLMVSGVGGGKDGMKSKVRFAVNNDVLVAVDPLLNRPIFLVDDAIKTEGQAESRATREMTKRRKQTDAWKVELDGLAYWDGSILIPWGVDTIADVDIDLAHAKAKGAYLIHNTTLKGSADGYQTTLEMVAAGLWEL